MINLNMSSVFETSPLPLTRPFSTSNKKNNKRIASLQILAKSTVAQTKDISGHFHKDVMSMVGKEHA